MVGMLINFVKMALVAALFWTGVINGVLVPPLLVMIMLVSNNHKVMGKRVNGRLTNIIGWSTAAIMSVAAIGMFATWGNLKAKLATGAQRKARSGLVRKTIGPDHSLTSFSPCLRVSVSLWLPAFQQPVR